GGGYDGRAGWRDPQSGRISDDGQPARTRPPVRAGAPADRAGGLSREDDGLTFFMRNARANDLQTLYEMAKLTGGGFTNLPPDRKALAAKLERTEQALSRTDESIQDELILMVLENAQTGQVRGTCQIFSMVGQSCPFYSYRLGVLTQHSRELGRTFRAQMLSLTTDLEGSTEVGGL